MRRILGVILGVIGIGIFFYPDAKTYYQNVHTEKQIEKFNTENKKKVKEGDVQYEASLIYNNRIYEERQNDMKETSSLIYHPVSLDEFKEQPFGYIKIPSMDLKLLLYIGASDENMEKGAAVLGGTSMPIGGRNTNSVIAGHRGYKGVPYFREIEKLKVGDKLYITNPWETLCYIAESIKIIDSYDIESIKIQEGKDMITLITCHPYRSHGKYRYVVYCVRDMGQEIKGNTKNGENLVQSSKKEIQTEKRFRAFCGVCILFLSLVTFMKKE